MCVLQACGWKKDITVWHNNFKCPSKLHNDIKPIHIQLFYMSNILNIWIIRKNAMEETL